MSVGFVLPDFDTLELDEPEIPCEFCDKRAQFMGKGCNDPEYQPICVKCLKRSRDYWMNRLPGMVCNKCSIPLSIYEAHFIIEPL